MLTCICVTPLKYVTSVAYFHDYLYSLYENMRKNQFYLTIYIWYFPFLLVPSFSFTSEYTYYIFALYRIIQLIIRNFTSILLSFCFINILGKTIKVVTLKPTPFSINLKNLSLLDDLTEGCES